MSYPATTGSCHACNSTIESPGCATCRAHAIASSDSWLESAPTTYVVLGVFVGVLVSPALSVIATSVLES